MNGTSLELRLEGEGRLFEWIDSTVDDETIRKCEEPLVAGEVSEGRDVHSIAIFEYGVPAILIPQLLAVNIEKPQGETVNSIHILYLDKLVVYFLLLLIQFVVHFVSPIQILVVAFLRYKP